MTEDAHVEHLVRCVGIFIRVIFMTEYILIEF